MEVLCWTCVGTVLVTCRFCGGCVGGSVEVVCWFCAGCVTRSVGGSVGGLIPVLWGFNTSWELQLRHRWGPGLNTCFTGE